MFLFSELLEKYPHLKTGDLIVVECTAVRNSSQTALRDDNLVVGEEYIVPLETGGINIAFQLMRNKYLGFNSYMFVDGGGRAMGYASFKFIRVYENDQRIESQI